MLHVSVNFVPHPTLHRRSPYQRFSSVTWLVENARHITAQFGDSKEQLCVVLVGNTDAIPGEVLAELRNSFILRIETEAYEKLCREYPALVKSQGGMYATFGFGFMRWLLIERLFGGEPVLCYDGDILHNVPLDALSRAFTGVTRTATSTCFASISNPDWFKAWARHAARLNRDPSAAFSEEISRLKGGRVAFSRSPEEFVAKFLIEAGELPHDEVDQAFPFHILPQPQMLPRLYNFVRTAARDRLATPMRYARVDGVDTINGKPVAFWHMQKPFMSQLSALALFRERPHPSDPRTVYAFNFYGGVARRENTSLIDPFDEDGGYDPVPEALLDVGRRLVEGENAYRKSRVHDEHNPFHPAFLYEYYFRLHDLSLLFNNARWPKPDCWEN